MSLKDLRQRDIADLYLNVAGNREEEFEEDIVYTVFDGTDKPIKAIITLQILREEIDERGTFKARRVDLFISRDSTSGIPDPMASLPKKDTVLFDGLVYTVEDITDQTEFTTHLGILHKIEKETHAQNHRFS